MTGGWVWTTAGGSARRAAGGSGWAWRREWTWGRLGRPPRLATTRPGPYHPVPAWVTQLLGYTDDRTGQPHALVTSYAGARVVLDLLDGRLVGAVDERAHASASATVRIAGEQMIVSGAGSGYLQVSDLDSGRTRWRRWCGDVRSLATVTLAGRPLAVLTGGSPNLQIWSLAADGGERVGGLRVGAERVAVLAATESGEESMVAVGTSTGWVSLWRLTGDPDGAEGVRGEPLGEYAFELPGLVTLLRFADWRDRRILLGAAGRLARAWELDGATSVGPAFAAHTGQVNSVFAGRLGDRPVLWSGDDSTVRAWSPETGAQLGEAYRYPYDAAPTCTIAVEIDGRPMLVTGDAAGLVWVWDTDRPYPFRRDLPGGRRRAEGPGGAAGPTRLAVAEVAGRPVLLAGFAGPAVRGFDPRSGAEVDVPLGGFQGAPVLVPGSPPTVARTGPDTIELWDPGTGARIGPTLSCPVGVVGPDGMVGPLVSGLVDGRWTLLVTAGAALYRFDVETGRLAGPWTGHSGPIRAITIGDLDGVPVVLTAAADDTVRLWSPYAGTGRTVLDGHGGAAYAVTMATVDGRVLALSAGRNGQVRCVDLVGTDPAAPPEPTVLMTATGPVRSLAVARSGQTSWLVAADGATLRWHPVGVDDAPGQTVELTAAVTDLVALPDVLLVAARDGLVGYRSPTG